jgi:hypothetical protein
VVLGASAIASYYYHRHGEHDDLYGFDRVLAVGSCFTTVTLFPALPLHMWGVLIAFVVGALCCYAYGEGQNYRLWHAMWHLIIAVGQCAAGAIIRTAAEMQARYSGVAGSVPEGFMDTSSAMLTSQRIYSHTIGSVDTDLSFGVFFVFLVLVVYRSQSSDEASAVENSDVGVIHPSSEPIKLSTSKARKVDFQMMRRARANSSESFVGLGSSRLLQAVSGMGGPTSVAA